MTILDQGGKVIPASQYPAVHTAKKSASVEAFTFGDSVPVLDKADIWNYTETRFNGTYYEPPVNLYGLAKASRANPHHASALRIKRDLLTKRYIPHPLLPRSEFKKAVQDFIIFGDGYLEKRRNIAGDVTGIKSSLAKYTRRAQDEEHYLFLETADSWMFRSENVHWFEQGDVFHLKEPDINQEIYGIAPYLSGLQSAFLNEASTLFRRRYFTNNANPGFILYLTDAAHDETDVKNLRTALKESKGIGNFKNLFMYAPNGDKDGLKIIPISEVSAKDDFFNIKNVSAEDVLVSHIMFPQLIGMVPHNASGFGSPADANDVFNDNVIEPMMTDMLSFNEWFGDEIITFSEYERKGDGKAAKGES